ncbi:GntR family transcriptional regulator [Allopusillimonas ginsengisoli]|uniref:GntR family transcriptional regulator n=1 Tax=Allopusillimonas ginsengisoli TaxID=453575 RepID=UPI0010C1BD05|nr:GntR family transcriptional regulator [Allopusillimonas ginsengisoli]
MAELDPSESIGRTLYSEIKHLMLRALSEGEWKAGDVIPSERRLCDRFGVSIGTLRKAVDELVAENILIRHQGRGTFVATHNREQQFFRFFNIVRHNGHKTYPDLYLLGFSKRPAGKMAGEKLQIASTAEVFRFVNVLSLQGEPTVVDEITVPETLFPGLTECELRERSNTLYHLYQVTYGLNVIRTEERLRAGLATEPQAALLNVAPGAPLLHIYRVAFTYNDLPVEWRVSYINTQNYEYFSTNGQ